MDERRLVEYHLVMVGFEGTATNAASSVSSQGSLNPRLKVLIGPLVLWRIMATIELESTPPESDTPTGTSESSCRFTPARVVVPDPLHPLIASQALVG